MSTAGVHMRRMHEVYIHLLDNRTFAFIVEIYYYCEKRIHILNKHGNMKSYKPHSQFSAYNYISPSSF